MQIKKTNPIVRFAFVVGIASSGSHCFADEPFLGETSPPKTQPKFVLQQEVGTSTDAIAFSPDSKILVTGSTTKGNEPEIWTGRVRLWDAQSGQLVRELKEDTPPKGDLRKLFEDSMRGGFSGPMQLAFSPDGKIIATATEVVTLWDASTGKPLRTLHWWVLSSGLSYQQFVTSIAFSPDSKEIVIGVTSGYNQVRIFDVDSGKQRWVLPVAKHRGTSGVPAVPVVISPNGKMIATGGESVRVWPISE